MSANTAVDVSPYTRPSATATPLGPGPVFSGVFTWYSHFSLPVARDIAYTLAYRSCMYTTPSATTGFAASEPAPCRFAAPWPVSLNVHASLSWDTFAAEIVEPVASLVLARSPFGYGQDPDGAAAPANVLVTGAGCGGARGESSPVASRARADAATRPA